ncbi:hypothetical protein CKO12_14285 [Chromatium okenii]|uniref:hypothetical protein n=1 Tax=Chromatium okenii TaxID=61644 RepID=UPI00190367FD|nr:hypothetical protein [Chromatium okenii]MBK1643009.1 hypothetical protein [Chromatium okenii]
MRYRKHAFHPLIIWARIAALLISATLAMPAGAATYIVTNLDDSGPGSLRQAVLDANASIIAVDTITFDPKVTGVITLTSGEINITDRKLTISGPGAMYWPSVVIKNRAFFILVAPLLEQRFKT